MPVLPRKPNTPLEVAAMNAFGYSAHEALMPNLIASMVDQYTAAQAAGEKITPVADPTQQLAAIRPKGGGFVERIKNGIFAFFTGESDLSKTVKTTAIVVSIVAGVAVIGFTVFQIRSATRG
jgi:hypothetical protein